MCGVLEVLPGDIAVDENGWEQETANGGQWFKAFVKCFSTALLCKWILALDVRADRFHFHYPLLGGLYTFGSLLLLLYRVRRLALHFYINVQLAFFLKINTVFYSLLLFLISLLGIVALRKRYAKSANRILPESMLWYFLHVLTARS